MSPDPAAHPAPDPAGPVDGDAQALAQRCADVMWAQDRASRRLGMSTPVVTPGRATIVMQKQPDGRWVGVHSHMSLGRGVPQDSHGKRPIKAR